MRLPNLASSAVPFGPAMSNPFWNDFWIATLVANESEPVLVGLKSTILETHCEKPALSMIAPHLPKKSEEQLLLAKAGAQAACHLIASGSCLSTSHSGCVRVDVAV